jgi:hypothetical protein
VSQPEKQASGGLLCASRPSLSSDGLREIY